MEQYVKLSNIGGGVLDEIFQEEWEKILNNISDPNRPPLAKRKLTISITLQPNENRQAASISVDIKPTLAPVVSYKSIISIGKVQDKIKAVEHGQMNLFDTENNKPKVVRGKNND